MSHIVVFITCPSEEEGKKIAKFLVENRHAACVNVIPGVTSFYFWDGKLNEDRESLLVIKTLREKFDLLKEEVKKIHPYTVPEIISISVAEGSDSYLAWVKEMCLSKP